MRDKYAAVSYLITVIGNICRHVDITKELTFDSCLNSCSVVVQSNSFYE